MGYYIETPGYSNRAKWIAEHLEGRIVSHDEAISAILSPEIGVVVVLHNPYFEAAGFAFSFDEFNALTSVDVIKDYVLLDRRTAELCSGYAHPEKKEEVTREIK